MKKKKGNLSNIVLILIFVVGLSLLVYPSFSNYWNQHHASHAISVYNETVAELDDKKCKELLEATYAYNEKVFESDGHYYASHEQEYADTLNIDHNGCMGYIYIPAISVNLPIYHGTSASVLATSVGHVDWTSLPGGGINTHCVLSGHRGLPSAQLFTHLDKLVVGDTFTIVILNENLTYQIDQISIVEPTEVDNIKIVEGEDYCTLVTCTPYGINTHRLLVRGKRVEGIMDGYVNVVSEAIQLSPMMVSAVILVPVVVIITLVVALGKKDKKVKTKQ